MSQQLGLLPDLQPRAPAPSGVRQVSVAAYQQLKDSGKLSKRARLVLSALEKYYRVKHEWPTTPELTRWMFWEYLIWKDDTKLVAPRISDLVNGVRLKGVSGRTRICCELLPLRTCSVTHSRAHSVKILSR